MDAWKKRVTRRADEFLIDFSRAIPPLSPGSLPFLPATTRREDRLDRISSEFVRKKKKRRVKDAHSRTWANFISRRRDPGGGQPIGIRLEDQLATIRRKSARIPRFKEGCGAFFSIISPSGIAFGKKQLGGLQPGRKSELPSFPVFMTSLIASQVAVGSATSFFALVPRHKLLPFVKHTSPSVTFFFELISTSCDTVTPNFENENPRLGGPRPGRWEWRGVAKGTIWSSMEIKQASNFRFGWFVGRLGNTARVGEDELSVENGFDVSANGITAASLS